MTRVDTQDTVMEISDYLKYRGKCKEMAEAAIAADPSLVLMRGHYDCPVWGLQAHWWACKPDGTVVDPSAKQFPSKGGGTYEPFNGIVTCAECGKSMPENEADFESNYAFCSYKCHMRFVGL